jgi:hypothetical protein
MSRRFAEGTTVTAGKTKGEIEDMLLGRGVDRFGTLADAQSATIVFSYERLNYQITISLPDPADPAFTQYYRGSVLYWRTESEASNRYAQELNRKWRALAAVIKAKLIAVDEGITTFEREFLAHVSVGNGETLGDRMIPQIQAAALEGRMPPTTLALPGGKA